jgi:predicted anti-sigma-YlaC factor YlaD
MRCEQVREALSARLDGESSASADALADRHVQTCAECADWYERAARITRLARTSVVPAAEIGAAADDDRLLDVVSAAAPGPGWGRAGRGLRCLLGLLGFGQFALGVAQIAALGMSRGVGSAGGMTSHHLLHESAAWNVAVGAAYLWIATRRARPNGVLPILTAFVAVLMLLSLDDLLVGEVAVGSLLTHAMVVLGYAVCVLLRHPGFDVFTPPGSRRWRLRADDFPDASIPAARRAPDVPIRGATASAERRDAA